MALIDSLTELAEDVALVLGPSDPQLQPLHRETDLEDEADCFIKHLLINGSP